jgi:putative PIN family toxin of toxin-antitoxin system
MRAVVDTNVVVSGLLWHGPSRRVLDLARSGRFNLYTSVPLLVELEDVLSLRKLARRLDLAGVIPRELVLGYAALAEVVTPAPIAPVILADPDDDDVLACALAAQADWVLSGDSHLLDLQELGRIQIVSPSRFLSLQEW